MVPQTQRWLWVALEKKIVKRKGGNLQNSGSSNSSLAPDSPTKICAWPGIRHWNGFGASERGSDPAVLKLLGPAARVVRSLTNKPRIRLQLAKVWRFEQSWQIGTRIHYKALQRSSQDRTPMPGLCRARVRPCHGRSGEV